MAIAKVTINNQVILDLTDATVTTGQDIISPKTAYIADGSKITGTINNGNNIEAPEKDVNFIDYDGRLLYSYTAAQAQALTALPANPTHTGLTAQGWNWTLAEIKAQLTAVPGGPVWVGQNYVTTSGITEIDITLNSTDALSPYLTFGLNGTATINWGDGSNTDTVTGSNLNTWYFTNHTYASPGNYTITISGDKHKLNGSSGYSGLFSNLGEKSKSNKYSQCVTAIRLGSNAYSLDQYSLVNCSSLRYVTIPSGLVGVGTYVFNGTYKIDAIVFPPGWNGSNGNYTRIGPSMKRAAIPPSATICGVSIWANSNRIKSITIPSGVTSIGKTAFSASKMIKLYIPSGVTSIGESAFQNCYSLEEIHLLPTAPPTLVNTNTFTGIQSYCKIYVPYSADHSILADYQSATNWADYVSYMQEEPQ